MFRQSCEQTPFDKAKQSLRKYDHDLRWKSNKDVYPLCQPHWITVMLITSLRIEIFKSFSCNHTNQSTRINQFHKDCFLLLLLLFFFYAALELESLLLIYVLIAILLWCHLSVLSLTSPLSLLSFFPPIGSTTQLVSNSIRLQRKTFFIGFFPINFSFSLKIFRSIDRARKEDTSLE